jgi:hypothetical protein
MLAMKYLAMRIGEGFRDEGDIRYLLRNLGIRRYDDAKEILERYYALEGYPETALLAFRSCYLAGMLRTRARSRKGTWRNSLQPAGRRA